jgi:hypothetical protein
MATAAANHLTKFLDLLANEGYRPKVIGDGDDAFVTFKNEGTKFLVIPDPREAAFFHVVLSFEAPEEPLEQLLVKANRINATWKTVKAVVTDHGSVGFHFEAVLDEHTDATVLLQRAVRVLYDASREFFDGKDEEAVAKPDNKARELQS